MSHGTPSLPRGNLRSWLVAGLAAFLLTTFGLAASMMPASVAVTAAKVDPRLQRLLRSPASRTVRVIVRESAPGTTTAEHLVGALGGKVLTQLSIIRGFSASIPERS